MTAGELQSWKEGVAQLQVLLDAREDRRRSPNFFRMVPRLLRKEGVHSDLLAWLLDPHGWHGLGEAFAHRFLGDALAAAGYALAGDFTITRVRTEVSTGQGPIDVLVELTSGARQLLVGIENKVDSPVGGGQLCRYARGLVEGARGRNVVLLLLAPTLLDETVDVPDCCFGTVTYRTVISALEAALADTTAGGAGTELARHYLEILRTNIVPESEPEIDKILNELYAENKAAWKEIRRRLPSERDENHWALANAICQRLDVGSVVQWRFAAQAGRYVRVFMPHWGVPFGQSVSERIVGLEADGIAAPHYPHVHFRFSIDAEDDADEWRYVAKLKLDARASPQLGAQIRAALAAKDLRVRDRDQDTTELGSAKLRAIKNGVVEDDVVEWFNERLVPIAELINRKLDEAAVQQLPRAGQP